MILQLDDWVLCRIYNKKGTAEKQQQPPTSRKVISGPEFEDVKPEKLMACPLPPASVGATRPNDYVYFDNSDSVPRLHTDSSCSEQVVSPEFTSEVQSEPKWKEWDKAFDFTYNYGDATVEPGFGSQFQGGNQMSPLQDMFMYLPRPY